MTSRRQFCKQGVAALLVLSAPVVSLASSVPSAVIIGIGGAGCNIVTRWRNRTPPSAQGIASFTVDLFTVPPIFPFCEPDLVLRDPCAVELSHTDTDAVRKLVAGFDRVCLVAGASGFTGARATPHIARCAKDAGALVSAVLIAPLDFEGRRRRRAASIMLSRLPEIADHVTTIDSESILAQCSEDQTFFEAFQRLDNEAIQALARYIGADPLSMVQRQ